MTPRDYLKRYPWGHPYDLGKLHATCGMPRLNPEFFKLQEDQLDYIFGYDLKPRREHEDTQSND